MTSSNTAECSGIKDKSCAFLLVENLSTVLDGQMIVDSVSLEVKRGEILGVVGD